MHGVSKTLFPTATNVLNAFLVLFSELLFPCLFLGTEKKMRLWLMVLKINQTYQPFVNSEECVGEKTRTGRGNVKKKERSIPHCFFFFCLRATAAGILLCPPWKKPFVETAGGTGWFPDVWMCARFWFRVIITFSGALFVHAWRSCESRRRVAPSVLCQNTAGLAGILDVGKRKSSLLCVSPSSLPRVEPRTSIQKHAHICIYVRLSVDFSHD